MAAITINAASLTTLTAAELRGLEFGRAQVNRTSGLQTPLANVKEYLEYRINKEIVAALIKDEGADAAAKVADKVAAMTDAERANIGK